MASMAGFLSFLKIKSSCISENSAKYYDLAECSGSFPKLGMSMENLHPCTLNSVFVRAMKETHSVTVNCMSVRVFFLQWLLFDHSLTIVIHPDLTQDVRPKPPGLATFVHHLVSSELRSKYRQNCFHSVSCCALKDKVYSGTPWHRETGI